MVNNIVFHNFTFFAGARKLVECTSYSVNYFSQTLFAVRKLNLRGLYFSTIDCCMASSLAFAPTTAFYAEAH